MTSLLFELPHPKEHASADLVSEVGMKLQEALTKRKSIEPLTQQHIAERLGIDRSRVNRCFSGYSNMTLGSLAELCWAMDVEPDIIFRQTLDKGYNDRPDKNNIVIVDSTEDKFHGRSETASSNSNSSLITYSK